MGWSPFSPVKAVGQGVAKAAGGVGNLISAGPVAALGGLRGLLGGRGGDPNDFPVPEFKKTSEQETNPMVRRLQEQLAAQKAQPPKTLQAEAMPAARGALPEFDEMRSRLRTESGRELQGANDAINRRFAALGASNSGAAIKQLQIAKDEAAKRSDDAMQSVNFQEAQQRRQLEEQDRQGALTRNFQRELVNADASFKDKVFNADQESKIAQLDLAFKEADHQREVDQYTIALNKLLAGDKQGLIGSLFGKGGVPILKDLPIVGGLFS